MFKVIIEITKLKINPINPAPEPNNIKTLLNNNFLFKARIPPAKTENAPKEAMIKIGINKNLIRGELTRS
ncbi:hypothetical protein J4411_03000 [Candidatus Pacearchaeota archaeon]|nr:hypothetical protein [Candidatus Pacearchaeota archaeon]